MKFLMICLFALGTSPFAIAAAYDGKSEVEFQKIDNSWHATVKNTEFRLDQAVLQKNGLETSLRLYEIKKTSQLDPGIDHPNSDFQITAYDPSTEKKLWGIQERADAFNTFPDYFLVQTEQGGDCQTSYRLYSGTDGKYLMSHSFVGQDKRPIVLRAGAFDPLLFRFIGYADSYWPCGKHGIIETGDSELTYAGVISYSGPNGVVQKIAVFLGKGWGDPSSDPDTVELTFKNTTVKFVGNDPHQSPAEYDFWWKKSDPKRDPQKLGKLIFSDISVKFDWTQDSLTIPIENDYLNIKKAKLGKYYKKLVEIPKKDWDQF